MEFDESQSSLLTVSDKQIISQFIESFGVISKENAMFIFTRISKNFNFV